ncbi:guanylate-binding protein 1-like [Caretta caretta]|uniref:guanylate-binding protein 1-like n=1 Tax=Caretta caretta TaxID=8467 RepID=UPI003F4C4165
MSWCKKWHHVPAQRQQRGGASGRFAAGQPDTRSCANAVLSALVKSYVDTTHSGNMPCLEDAVTATENKMGVTEALAHYVAETEMRVAFPAAMMELSERHGKSLADALQLFMQLSLKAETELSAAVWKKHTDGVYMLPGGYQDLRDQSHVVNFRTTPNNGVKVSG